jgi:hypothetical protein
MAYETLSAPKNQATEGSAHTAHAAPSGFKEAPVTQGPENCRLPA